MRGSPGIIRTCICGNKYSLNSEFRSQILFTKNGIP